MLGKLGKDKQNSLYYLYFSLSLKLIQHKKLKIFDLKNSI